MIFRKTLFTFTGGTGWTRKGSSRDEVKKGTTSENFNETMGRGERRRRDGGKVGGGKERGEEVGGKERCNWKTKEEETSREDIKEHADVRRKQGRRENRKGYKGMRQGKK